MSSDQRPQQLVMAVRSPLIAGVYSKLIQRCLLLAQVPRTNAAQYRFSLQSTASLADESDVNADISADASADARSDNISATGTINTNFSTKSDAVAGDGCTVAPGAGGMEMCWSVIWGLIGLKLESDFGHPEHRPNGEPYVDATDSRFPIPLTPAHTNLYDLPSSSSSDCKTTATADLTSQQIMDNSINLMVEYVTDELTSKFGLPKYHDSVRYELSHLCQLISKAYKCPPKQLATNATTSSSMRNTTLAEKLMLRWSRLSLQQSSACGSVLNYSPGNIAYKLKAFCLNVAHTDLSGYYEFIDASVITADSESSVFMPASLFYSGKLILILLRS